MILDAAASPRVAALLSRLWLIHGCGPEALALVERARLPNSPFLLRVLAGLGLHSRFLELCPPTPPPVLSAALGRALLETGQVEAAIAPLQLALSGKANWSAWLNAAAALAIIDPDRPVQALRGREDEPLVALLLAHLAERRGDAGQARRLAEAAAKGTGRPAETDLLRSAVALSDGDPRAGAAWRNAALAKLGLGPFETTTKIAAREAGDSRPPMVSIIVAAHDAESTIDAALLSLLTQSWQRLEVILVDDGSSDATADRAERIAQDDARLRVVRMPRNGGAYIARNVGLSLAQGDFVTFHDADDMAHPRRIALQLAPLLADQTLVATTARWIRCDSLLRTRDRQILPAIRFHTGSVMVRRAFERTVLNGFDPVRFGADGDFLARLRAAAGAGRVLRMGLPLTLSQVGPGSAVHDPVSGYGDRGYSIERLAYREARMRKLLDELKG